jgi:uridine kinase
MMIETHLRKGRQVVMLGLIKVVHDLFPDEEPKISYSIPEGVFFSLFDSVLSTREVKLIDVKLHEWAAANHPVRLLYQKDGYYHYQVGDIIIKAVYPAHTEPAMAEPFTIIPFSNGLIVDFGDIGRSKDVPLIPPRKLSESFEKNQQWLNNIDIELVADVNAQIASGQDRRVIGIGEALHEKQIADIADIILQQRRALRVLLISGPSSSGKTSFIQRIATQMEVNALKPVALNLDDYYVDRERTPKDSEGNYDFECIEALDLELLQRHIVQLIHGETIDVPCYDFVGGCRTDEHRRVSLGPSEILVMEGIHALNPRLMTNVNPNYIFKIYVSALGGLNIDMKNRIPTTEVRLIRRMVRDDRFRGISPEETIEQWPRVRAGEYQNVFAYQEEADVMFNTSVLYELNALRPYAEETLAKISDDGPHADTKERLLNLLSFFQPIDVEKVPHNSIIREFIGGSIYFPQQ